MKNPSSQQGFTIPEVVITSLLILVVMLPISNLGFQVVRNTRYSQDMGTALSIGQRKLEEFGTLDYTAVQSGTETVDGYALTWTVTEANQAKVLRLLVGWQIRSQNRAIELSTVYPSNLNAGFSFE